MMNKSKSAYERGKSPDKTVEKRFVTMLSFSVFCRSIQSDSFYAMGVLLIIFSRLERNTCSFSFLKTPFWLAKDAL